MDDTDIEGRDEFFEFEDETLVLVGSFGGELNADEEGALD